MVTSQTHRSAPCFFSAKNTFNHALFAPFEQIEHLYLFIFLKGDGHLHFPQCFLYKKDAVNIQMLFCTHVNICLGSIPISGIAGSKSTHICNFDRYGQIALHREQASLHSSQSLAKGGSVLPNLWDFTSLMGENILALFLHYYFYTLIMNKVFCYFLICIIQISCNSRRGVTSLTLVPTPPPPLHMHLFPPQQPLCSVIASQFGVDSVISLPFYDM